MNDYKRCSNGHYYSKEMSHCPYCPQAYVSMNDIDFFADRELARKMMSIPICRHCGHPVRKGIPRPPYTKVVVSSLNDVRDRIVPWNFEWDGKCEHCGTDYNFFMELKMGSGSGSDNRSKRTTVKVASKGYLHNLEALYGDEFSSTILSGVVIRTETTSQREEIFLSSNELRYLIKSLINSPVIQQFDYQEEPETMYRT